MSNCLHCNSSLKTGSKYCSTQCQNDHQRLVKVQKWLNGELSGMRGKTSTAQWIKWYLIRERGEKCEKCGWGEKNPYTEKIPIELEHIDGNFENNNIENLILLCPNCHSLTKTYKGANKGNGRDRKKYYLSSAHSVTNEVELPKFRETLTCNDDGNPEQKSSEEVSCAETLRVTSQVDEEKVQTTNSVKTGDENRS